MIAKVAANHPNRSSSVSPDRAHEHGHHEHNGSHLHRLGSSAHKSTYTPAAWEERAVELAYSRGTVGTADWLSVHPIDDIEQLTHQEMWQVPSVSEPGTVHIVVYDRPCRQISCNCPAGVLGHGVPCSHVGAVVLALRELHTAVVERREAEVREQREWEADRRYHDWAAWHDEHGWG